ncbi:MAG: DUF86 domain-containing protein [archaeon]
MRINDKINEIEQYLSEMSQIIPSNIEEYLQIKNKAACERYFEKIVEAVADLAHLVIKEKRLKNPEEDNKAFEILSQEGIIPESLCEKLESAKGMRNIISHQYGIVDDETVFESITEELIEDVEKFIKSVRVAIK